MNKGNESPMDRTLDDFAQMIVEASQAARADAIICVTEDGDLFHKVREMTDIPRVIAATASRDTLKKLQQSYDHVVHLPARAITKSRQAHLAVSMSARAGKLSEGEMITCAVGHDRSKESGDMILMMDLDASAVHVAIHELLKHTDDIHSKILEAAITVACLVGQAARRGRHVGIMLVIGDTEKVLNNSRQLVFNPFQDRKEDQRMLTDPTIHGMILELSKLDGAFIIGNDGLIETAGTFLDPGSVEVEVPPGLGTRHTTAAKVSARSKATIVTVSAADGDIRVFSRGEVIIQMDPSVPLPLPPDTQTPEP